ncbi:hypothetical protein DPEC_G00171240 [Dallia pectoralis]|uniref:Uncharacterized protein n=1 Tax=Dallia pectoralis TaxID=75939 RepID=A0ACC2GDD0_DALPE|nr:hypothetical protein DPEC_G00171240 [Dallia pectoralis]
MGGDTVSRVPAQSRRLVLGPGCHLLPLRRRASESLASGAGITCEMSVLGSGIARHRATLGRAQRAQDGKIAVVQTTVTPRSSSPPAATGRATADILWLRLEEGRRGRRY